MFIISVNKTKNKNIASIFWPFLQTLLSLDLGVNFSYKEIPTIMNAEKNH